MTQTPIGARRVLAAKLGISLDDLLLKMAAGEKWCWKCREWKPIGQFNADRTRYDGRSSTCQACSRVKVRVCTKGRVSTFKGRTHTAEARAKLSAKAKGRPGAMKGKTHSPDARAKMSAAKRKNALRGPDHYAWKGGKSQRAFNDRRRVEYKDWRNAVFERDGYACQKCGDRTGGNLRAHHIKRFADFPELRFEVGNGLTLCHTCHELEHFKPDSIRVLRKAKRGQPLFK